MKSKRGPIRDLGVSAAGLPSLTLEEKCSLLSGGSQFTSKAIPRLGIPALYLADGPSGVRKQEGPSDHLGLNPSLPATCFPSPATLANAWDETLEEQVGALLGEEAQALRVNVLLGPGLNIKRDPLCGRNFEYFSEDPYLAGKLAAACIRGIQSRGVAACPKHFAVNSQETLRMHSDSVLDERTLREIYLTAFEIAVKEGRPLAIMSAYNRINGVYASEDPGLLQHVLRDEWGFQGISVTDWGGSNDRVAGLIAGTHLEMPTTGGDGDRAVEQAVRDGRLPQAVLDQRVDEYLSVLSAAAIPEDAPDTFDQAAHHAFAQQAAAQSVVLLKNDGGLLPLAPGIRTAVLGDFAQTPRYQGAGSSNVNALRVDSPLDGLREAGVDLLGFAPGFRRHGGEDPGLLEQAVALARQADVVLLFLGLDELAETEGMDRPSMALRPNQLTLWAAAARANPNLVVVLSGGAPMELPLAGQCRAIVHAGLGGQAGGGAIADVLTGRVNPSGKLAESWPMVYADAPCAGRFPAPERTAEYREGPFIGYRYYDSADLPVRFPFGYGLSYTTFAWSGLTVSPAAVSFTLTNTGPVAGAEVAQLYVSKADSPLFRPVQELKGFAKVFLEPGESRRVTIGLDDKAFRFFHLPTHAWAVEGGVYQIRVGASSRDIRLTGQVTVDGIRPGGIYDPVRLPSYYTGRIRQVDDDQFAALLGHPIPPARWDRSAPLELNDTFAQLEYARSPIGRLVYRVTRRQVDWAMAAGKPDLDALFRYNMPFRAIAKMTGGAVSLEMAQALLTIFNGHLFRGTGALLAAFFRKNRAVRATETALAGKGAGKP